MSVYMSVPSGDFKPAVGRNQDLLVLRAPAAQGSPAVWINEVTVPLICLKLVSLCLVNKNVFSHVQDSARCWGHEDEPKVDSICPQGLRVRRRLGCTCCSLRVSGQLTRAGGPEQKAWERGRESQGF